MSKVSQRLGILFALTFAITSIAAASTAPLDQVQFGDAVSETTHKIAADHSEIIKGGIDQPARQLLPLSNSKEGGHVAFTLKVDGTAQNYFTIKLWGGDSGTDRGRLILSCEGKQVGYRDQGDIDTLDVMVEEPRFPGHFFYTTMPLPRTLTDGKSEVSLTIQAIGSIWVYGNKADNYHHPMVGASRGIYAAYTQTEPYLDVAPTAGETYVAPATRPEQGAGVMAALVANENAMLDGYLRDNRPLDVYRTEIMARAYSVRWTTMYQKKAALDKVVFSLDELMRRYDRGEETPKDPKGVPNDWFGFGTAGAAVNELAEPLQPLLDASIDDGVGGKIKRRDGWAKMLVASRDYWRQYRRWYTNQTMIIDLNIYRANRGVEILDPSLALTEPEIRRYLYESFGLYPWTGHDDLVDGKLVPNREAHAPGAPVYNVYTSKGLSKELGYVGGYGEILDWATEIYLATETNGENGDPKLRERLKTLLHARSFFREPAVDELGYRAMRLEQVVGWRDHEFPGLVCYTMPIRTEGSALAITAALGDPVSAGYAQQMFADRQFFPRLAMLFKDHGSRTVRMLLEVPGEYAKVLSLPRSSERLPMTPGAPDVAFTDEEDGVVAVKHGDELFYASLYYRAQQGINHLARVHLVSPGQERDATVAIQETFTPSGLTYKRPNLPNRPFAPTPWEKLDGIHIAGEGEELPIAAPPAGAAAKAGDSTPYAGRALFYVMRYGHYLVGMNSSTDHSYVLRAPAGVTEAQELVTGKTLHIEGPLTIAPKSTVILYLPEAAQ
jgi:hypothetical protein